MIPYSEYEDPSGSNVALIVGIIIGMLCLTVVVVVSVIFVNRFLKTKGNYRVTDEHDASSGL